MCVSLTDYVYTLRYQFALFLSVLWCACMCVCMFACVWHICIQVRVHTEPQSQHPVCLSWLLSALFIETS